VYITSEGAALCGLVLGTKLLGLPWTLVGLDWRPQQPDTTSRLQTLIAAAAELLGVSNPVGDEDITIHDTGGPAYGVGSPASWRALATAAHLEGLVLDPVYTAKGLAGLLADLEARPLPEGDLAVFFHTGGVGALFAYEAELRRHVLGAWEQQP
jgi:1-aminocyclopropane-1-carboxylate deaminase/D-cysteine desulfhydrase-like pyridoxal-dependent ACC family enzyme